MGVAVLLGGLALHLWRSSELRVIQVIGLAMILGGGLANLGDRMSYGFVRDFAQLRLGPVRTGVFNGADLAITTGVVVVALYWIWGVGRRRRAV